MSKTNKDSFVLKQGATFLLHIGANMIKSPIFFGHFNEQTPSQSEDESMTICKDALFAEFEEYFGLKNRIGRDRPFHFKKFISEINKCIGKNKSSHYPKVTSDSEV